LMMMGRGVFRRDERGRRLLINVLIAFIPSAALGLLLHDWIDEHLYSKGGVIFGLTAGSLLMFMADKRGRALAEEGEFLELNPHGAAWIGFLQLAFCNAFHSGRAWAGQ
jgi:undecaprenyl-diphosphatase